MHILHHARSIENIRKSVFSRIFLLLLVPVACIFISSLITYLYYVKLFENEAKTNYHSALSAISENMNSIFYEIYKTNNLLTIDKNLTDIMSSDTLISNEDYYKIVSCVESLIRFRSTKNLIDSVYILYKPGNKVISVDGVIAMDDFYNRDYHYKDYPKIFWLGLALKSGEFRILNPSEVDSTIYTQKSKNIIPLVQAGLGTFFTKNIFVVNINEGEFCKMLEQYRFTPNSILFITDNNGTIFSRTGTSSIKTNIKDTPLEQILQQKKNTYFYEDIDGQKMMVITHTSKVMSKEFIYTACVPLQDLYNKTSYIKTTAYFFSFLTLILAAAISFFIAGRLYSPIKNLVGVMKRKSVSVGQSPSDDELDFLNSGIQKIITDTENLSRDLSYSLPFVCEQYLLNLLNQYEFFDDSKVEALLQRGGVVFRHPYFLAAIIQLSFSKKFYESFDRDEQLAVYNGTKNIIRSLFPDNWQVTMISTEKDKLTLVINLPEETCSDTIEAYISKFYDIYSNDRELLEIYTGIGRVYRAISGLRNSYKEALNALSLMSPFRRERIRIYSPEKINVKYLYTLDEESKLFNFLLAGRGEDVEKLLNSIIENNFKNNISDSYMKELYLQLYLTAQRVLNNRDFTTEELMEEEYINLTVNYLHMSPKEIADYIAVLFKKITGMNGEDRSTIDIKAIKEYIDTHFQEDIYLEKLADKYITSASYLSRLLKEYLGMSFNQYLANLRIAKAKDLLSTTNETVNVIAEKTGFNSRNTFIRMFKKHEGVIPTEYRKISRLS